MAKEDVVAAQASGVPYSICFHAQQAAEKYLKAFLAYHGRPVPNTHDVKRLVEQCVAIDGLFGSLLDAAESLTPFGVEIRYQPTKVQADSKCPEVWSAMLSILETVKQRLPSSVVSDE